LLGNGRISREADDLEPLTDLATVYFGMGIFVANASLRDRNYHVGNWEVWSVSRQGYLTAPILAYALALFAWLRQEAQPDWARYLRLDVRSPFWKALSYLVHTENAVILPAETQDGAGSPACPADLLPHSGRPQDNSQKDEDSPVDAENSANESEGTAADQCFTQATFLVQQGLWAEAIQLLSEVLVQHPRDGEACQQRALAYLGLGKPTDGLADAEQAVRWSPEDPESYRVRGIAYLDSQQYDRAIADFTRYLEDEGTTRSNSARVGTVYHSRGTAYAKEGDLSRAVADFTKAIRCWPQWPAPYEARARIYERLGKIDKALADREEAAQRTESLGKHESVPQRWNPIP
jgi:tetratricopeptide (TPR) repeat protein